MAGRYRRSAVRRGRAMLAAGLTVAFALAAGAAACSHAKLPRGPRPGTSVNTGQQPGAGDQPTAGGSASGGAAVTGPSTAGGAHVPDAGQITSWSYQLQGYGGGGLDQLARAPHKLAVIDLARDAKSGYFRADEIAAMHRAGKTVLAYFEIGSLEDFRPEYPKVRQQAGDLILNRWADWPNEFFVRYWDARWWDQVLRPRVDQALRAGFDGVYLDTPLAYEEIDLSLVPGSTRDSLGRSMVDLIVKLSKYAKAQRKNFWVFPQNSPELRRYPGYPEAIDGIGMEELFFLATDEPCTKDYCAENLQNTRALRDAGKLVLAVDYATRPENIRAACQRYASERFVGYVTVRDLDRIAAPCG